tara:strand:- start:28147 stop:28392 length:246 start_codon:yes stop_codon:yes gene_type:complete
MEEQPTKPIQSKPAVRYCVNNPRSLKERQELLDKGFICRDCLSNCTRCFETRFLEIHDTFVEGDSYEEILDKADQHQPNNE